MEVKRGYKQTESGVIPSDWEVKSVKSIGDVCAGKALASKAPGQMRPYLRTKNVFDGRIDIDDVLSMPMTENEFSRYCLREGDILLNEGQSIELVGRCAMYKNEYPHPCAIQNQLVRFRAYENTSASFATHLFRSCQTRGVFSQIAMQTTSVAHLGVSRFQNLKLPLPPTLAEQEAIATALSDADAWIESLEQLIAKKRQIKQGAMQELLTGKRRLPGFSGEWERKRLGEIAHIKTGSRNNENKVEDGEYPFFVRSEVVERINSYSHDCEAILVPGEGRIGDIFHYINGRFDVHQRVYAITKFVPGISGRFIHFYLAKNFGTWAMQNTVKATVDSLRLPTFQTFELLLPSSEAEQTAIAEVISDMDTEIESYETKLTKARQIKQGMMQELLTGRIRLV
jgi:type I restriction enzyme S subunit